MFYILIQNGAVHEVIPEYHDDFPGIHISERYAPDFIAQTVQSDVEIPLGWLYDSESGTFSPPPEPPEGSALLPGLELQPAPDVIAELRVELSELRAQVDGMAGAVQEFASVAATRAGGDRDESMAAVSDEPG